MKNVLFLIIIASLFSCSGNRYACNYIKQCQQNGQTDANPLVLINGKVIPVDTVCTSSRLKKRKYISNMVCLPKNSVEATAIYGVKGGSHGVVLIITY